MNKRWKILSQSDADQVQQLSKQLNINPVLSNLLLQRGITSYDDAFRFFRPSLSFLHNPNLMADMHLAVARIEQAIAKGEHVLIYGDYDVDGTTAVAMMYRFFKTRFAQCSFYIPDRYAEGYGISIQGINWASEQGISLIIALDCGIKANDKIAYAQSKGIDFIICDHHRPGTTLPEAVAVLDPKRTDCNYPCKDLSGCGVGFKLIQAFAEKNGVNQDEVFELIDLVAISIAADIVPITGENRILAHFGLQQINKSPRIGIKAILELNAIRRHINISDVVFIIAPRINAAGRMDHGKSAVQLLISDEPGDANIESLKINQHNIERRDADKQITEHALEQIIRDNNFATRRSTVVYHSSWNKGVIGIVASRLTEKYYRPTIVLTDSNGHIAGSARSVKDFDVYNAIEACSEYLDQFGGHMYAAGLTLKHENLEAFRQKFEEVVCATIEEHMLTPEIEIDSELRLKDVTSSFYDILRQFEPFGPGNMSPIFVSRNCLADKNLTRTVGQDYRHLKISLRQDDSTQNFSGIGFQLGEYADALRSGKRFDVCYHIEENHFNGNSTLQLNIKDIKLTE
jgi:single-stranded-DNA-specific exonuclease